MARKHHNFFFFILFTIHTATLVSADAIQGCGGFIEASSSLIKSRKPTDSKLDYSHITISNQTDAFHSALTGSESLTQSDVLLVRHLLAQRLPNSPSVNPSETVLLRVINAALNQQLFFTVANHTLTMVATNAAYTKPFTTNVIMVGPGQTTDVLLTADQKPGRYYMAARAYASARNAAFDNTTTTAILEYKSVTSLPILPPLPTYNDTNTVTSFSNQIKSPGKVNVPTKIDENLFFTVGFGFFNCSPGPTCQGPNNTRFGATMNNVSFVLPNRASLLQAYTNKIPNIYTADFPPTPPVKFDYTGNVPRGLWQPIKGTKLYDLKFASNVQIVLQDTSIFSTEDHPVHLHGYHFYVVGQGFGNFNPSRDTVGFNLIDPPQRNTIDIPVGGRAAIRFIVDNPGLRLMHCHIDTHLAWGFGMAFIVEDGAGPSQTLLPPPADLPRC